MLGEPLAALVRAGGTALVGAMGTECWETARSSAARLFGCGAAVRQHSTEALLDASAVVVTKAEDADQARQRLLPVWCLELESLLRRHPEVEDELRILVAELHAALPAPQRTWVQAHLARD
jgi:hypothetical protein